MAPTTAPPSGRPPLAALLLVVAVGLAFADASVVALALPDLYGELDTTIVGVSWVLTTYALVVALTAIPVALLHRRIRPAVLAGTGLGLFAVASLAAGLASSLPFLLTARAFQGVGATLLLAGSIPVLGAGLAVPAPSPAVVGRRRRRRRRRRSGPGRVLTQLLAWRAIFLVQAPVAAVALLACVTPTARALVVDRQIGAAAPAGRPPRRPSRQPRLRARLRRPRRGALPRRPAGHRGVELPADHRRRPGERAARRHVHRPLGGPGAGVLGAVGGPLLLAAGLAGLAFLPGASPWAAAIAFALCGAGFGVVSGLLDPATTPDHGELVRDSTVSIGARHAGLVLGLVLIAPVLTASLDNGIDRATLGRHPVHARGPGARRRQGGGHVEPARRHRHHAQGPGARPGPGVRRARRQGQQRDGGGPATG